jgi:hypothetical protein
MRRPRLPRLARSHRAERVAELTLATKQITGHLQMTDGGVWAWYMLAPQLWAFTTDADRERIWSQVTHRFAALRGHGIRLRVSSKPFPAYEFARGLARDTPNPLPRSAGVADDFDTYLERQQKRLLTSPIDDSVVCLGVRISDPVKPAVMSELREATEYTVSAPAQQLLVTVQKMNESMAGVGFSAQPLTPRQMAWLMHRSLAMGMPVPVSAGVAGRTWEEDDLYAFTDPVEWLYSPLGDTVRIEARVKETMVTRHVAVLSIGRMPDQTFPESGRDPWILASSRLAFPVEWSLSGRMLSPSELTSTIDYERSRAESIRRDYETHDETPPPAVNRAIVQAIKTADEVTEGDPREATRFCGPIRAAVYGATEADCLERARKLIDIYSEKYRIEVVHPRGQVQLLREFIPGEPWSTTGYQRRFNCGYLASAMPHVSSSVGTPTGPFFAYTMGTAHRAVRHDGHFGMEKLNTPGVFPVIAEPGGGKSFAIGVLMYHAAERGEATITLDPSGPLARLCQMPRLAPISRHLNLTDAQPGTLAPWQLVPEPQRHEFSRDRDYDRAKRRAEAERKQLAFDTFRMLLPSAMIENPNTDAALREAIRALGGGAMVNSRRMLNALDDGNGHSRDVAAQLRDAADYPLAELIFPDSDLATISEDLTTDKKLVVISMPGLVLPAAGSDRRYWSSEELYAQPLLHLAAFYTSRFIYRREMHARKNIFMDENHFMGQWGSGRALMIRLARDSRKWNTAVYPASQHPDDILGVGKIEALIGGAFIGRLEDDEAAAAAMRLLRVSTEYANVAQRLSPRPPPGQPSDASRSGEFIYRDAYGRVDKIRVDAAWHPELMELLNTTPSGHARITATPPTPSLFLDETGPLFDLEGSAA